MVSRFPGYAITDHDEQAFGAKRGLAWLPAAVVVTVGAVSSAQIPGLPPVPGVLNPAALVDRIFRRSPALTTDLTRATGLFAFLPDDFDPGPFDPMTWLPRSPDGAFQLRPGAWEFAAESYCLQPGTRRPNQGHGYMTSPITGPRGEIVRHILQHAATRPDISQENIQTLLWAILARTDPRGLSRELQRVAAALLSPRELAELGTDTLGVVALGVLQSALPDLPPLVQQALEAETNLRDQLAKGASYTQLERIAVPDSSVQDDDPQTVAVGRWVLGSGYFVRYFPSGYQRVRVQVYVPGFEIVDDFDPRDLDWLRPAKKVGGLLNAPGFLIRPAVYRAAGKAGEAAATRIMMVAAAGGGHSFDPTSGAAVPGDAGDQWLGISSRSAPDWNPGPPPPEPKRRKRPAKPPTPPPAPKPDPPCKELTPGEMHDLASNIDGLADSLDLEGRGLVADACPPLPVTDIYPSEIEFLNEEIAKAQKVGDASSRAYAQCRADQMAALTFDNDLPCARAREFQRQAQDKARRLRDTNDLLKIDPDAGSCTAQKIGHEPPWGSRFKTNDDWPEPLRNRPVPKCVSPD